MKVSFNWLKELVELPWSVEETAGKLAELGFPVESIATVGVSVSNVVSVKIVSVARHPNADRLQIAQVTDGKNERTIVCGAPNIAVGQIVPCAMPGAKLPGGIEIVVSKIRGVESNGMLCSERELALSTEHAGILQLPANAPLGREVKEILGSDTVLDIEITPNRPDLMSHIGVARELAVLAGQPLRLPTTAYKAATKGTVFDIKIEEPKLCSRYTGKLIHGVKIGPSPSWMVERLKACGIRSINNVVDITNYVLLEWGHPLHAFDVKKIKGEKLVVRRAKPAERFLALDEKTYELRPNDLVISDVEDAVAIAGVMGGQLSGVTNATTDLLLESAVFDRVAVRETSRRLALRSESSIRFEKGTDPETADAASERAASLILELAGGAAGRSTDVYPVKQKKNTVVLRKKRMNDLIGAPQKDAAVAKILKSMNLDPKATTGGWKCTVPAYRKDLVEEVDLIEEVVRMIGYNNVPTAASSVILGNMTNTYKKWDEGRLVDFLQGCGLTETITSSFCLPELAGLAGARADQLAMLANPLSKEEAILRPNLLANLLKAVQRNLNYQQDSVRLFETGHVFTKISESEVREEKRLAGVLCGFATPKAWNAAAKEVDVFALKGILEELFRVFRIKAELIPSAKSNLFHPYQAFDISWRGKRVGQAGVLHPNIKQQLDITPACAAFEIDMQIFQSESVDKTVPLPRYPFVERDIAVIIGKEKLWADISRTVSKAGGAWLKDVFPFDLFEGGSLTPDQKSIAFRVRLQHPEHTLSESEITGTIDAIKNALKANCGAQLR